MSVLNACPSHVGCNVSADTATTAAARHPRRNGTLAAYASLARRRALSFQPDDCVHEVYATSQTAQTVDMLEYEELDAMLARE